MADFRKYALAIAGAACFMGIAGTASAQTTSGINCVANAATPLQMRAEGVTEQAGDVVLSCQGGTPTPLGVQVPAVNVTVALNTQVTSRLYTSSTVLTDALLLINDPAPGSQSLCPVTINNSCTNVTLGTGAGGGKNIVNLNNVGQYTINNVYQGILTAANTVTFFNVPIDAPGSAFVSNGQTIQPTLTLRVTNIRANASSLGAPTGFSSTAVTEFISTSAGFTISNPSQTVGNILTGLVSKGVSGVSSTVSAGLPLGVTSGSAGPTLTQCSSKSLSSSSATAALVEYVNFTEGFATATKLRYSLLGQGAEGIPGNPQNAEADFLLNGSSAAGLGTADFATRVQITFNNLPAGVTIYVPTTLPSTTLTTAGTPTEFMTLTATASGAFSPVTASTVSNLPSAFAAGSIYGGFAAPTITAGSASAVYEVTTQTAISQNTIETFNVPVVVTYTASPGTGSPGLGTTTVLVDFAPISTVSTAAASPIPRFISTSASLTGFTISTCATNLLFPFVTNQAGFDTGLAIASTSQDPFGTVIQGGTCTLNFYGSGAPAAFTTPTIAGGTVYTTLTSTVAAGFQGYLIAQCKFQYAHGFAFITDGFGGPGKGLSEGYLALIIPDTSIVTRAPNPNVTTSGAGEVLSN